MTQDNLEKNPSLNFADKETAPVSEPSRGEIKRFRREEATAKKRTQRAVFVLVAGAVIVFLGAGIYFFGRKTGSEPGEFFPEVGREHIPLGAEPPKPYNSNPPSSGGHFRSPASWGVYDYEVPDQIFIHNLEHGGVWIAYSPLVSEGVIKDLEDLVNEFGGSKIVMAPRSANDSDIALVAWTRVLKFEAGERLTQQNKESVRSFYRAYKNRGPEFVPDTMPGINPADLININN